MYVCWKHIAESAAAQYGAVHGLPRPYSGHMSFADWGPPPDRMDGPVLLVFLRDATHLPEQFSDCREVGEIDNGVDLDNEEQGSPVVLCDGPHRPWSQLWSNLTHFY